MSDSVSDYIRPFSCLDLQHTNKEGNEVHEVDIFFHIYMK